MAKKIHQDDFGGPLRVSYLQLVNSHAELPTLGNFGIWEGSFTTWIGVFIIRVTVAGASLGEGQHLLWEVTFRQM